MQTVFSAAKGRTRQPLQALARVQASRDLPLFVHGEAEPVVHVLITGGTGFVGSFIAEHCLRAGHEVTCTIRPRSDLKWLDGLAVDTLVVNLGRQDELTRALSGKQAVIHAAGVTRATVDQEYADANVTATRNLATAAAEAGAKRFVFISSLAARGPDHVAKDNGDKPVSEYGRSKLTAERELRELDDALEVVILRLGGVYGPRDRDFLPLFRMAQRGFLPVPNRPTELQLLYVEDAAAAALEALRAEPGSAPLPVAEQRRYGQAEFAAAMARAVDREVRMIALPPSLFTAAALLTEPAFRILGKQPMLDRRRAVDAAWRSWTCDVEETSRVLGWRAQTNLGQGLAMTADWYRAQRWL